MNERRKIEDRLRKKEQELQAFDEQMKATKVYIQALQDVLKILPKEVDLGLSAQSILRNGSAVAQARDIIIAKETPVHISDILLEMEKEPTRENRANLVSSLAAYVRKGEIFARTAPNTFGLIELGHHTLVDSDDEPPADFGRTPQRPPNPNSAPPPASQPPTPKPGFGRSLPPKPPSDDDIPS